VLSTAKERDSESGLDYFGARYYGSALGRFTSPDQPFADQHQEDPQSWNLYSYVRNNPLANVDPIGLDCITTSNQSAGGVSVTTERGGSADTCSGTYVEGTVDTSSYKYDGSNLSYSYSNDNASGAGTIGFGTPRVGGDSDNISPFGAAVVRSVGARTDASYQMMGVFAAGSLATGGGAALYDPLVGAISGWRAAQLAAALKAAQEAWKQIPLAERQPVMEWLSKIKPGAPPPGPLPPGASVQALQAYKDVAVQVIRSGKDIVGTQALRVQAIDNALPK
jgi:RHS repeat-associated protein